MIDFSTSIYSIIPPVLALALAVITKRVLLSLSVGIIVGALMLSDFAVGNSISYIASSVASLVYSDGAINTDYVYIIIFLILLGVLTSILTFSGSNRAFANWAQQHIKGKRGAKVMTVLLGVFIFIDDYFNSLAVGAIARPVTDRFKISRAKLAYFLDSTAAPICVITPVSSWGAYIITLISALLIEHGIRDTTPIGAFMELVSMNYYAIFALILVFCVAYFNLDIGAMARFEKLAQEKEDSAFENEELGSKSRVSGLILPILLLIIGTVFTMLKTGNDALAADGKAFSILGAFENTSVGISLVIGGLCGVITASIYAPIQGVGGNDYFKAWYVGAKSMLGAILILFFAWTINNTIGDMQTGKYLSSLVEGNLNVAYLPVVLFVISGLMAFSTGTSWGTFGIMLPIGATIAVNADPSLVIPCLSAVMAGAVCGDHCSPISDTTILSSTGAECNHIDHVLTQMPYALVVAGASAIGFLVLGFTRSNLVGFTTTLIALVILVLIFKSKNNSVKSI